jgi:hypothetical protein
MKWLLPRTVAPISWWGSAIFAGYGASMHLWNTVGLMVMLGLLTCWQSTRD